MKTCIENRDLFDGAERSFDDLDSFKFGSVMQRGKRCHAGNHSFHFRRNEGGIIELMTAMHDAMSDSVDAACILQDCRSSPPQGLQHAFHRSPSVSSGHGLMQHSSA